MDFHHSLLPYSDLRCKSLACVLGRPTVIDCDSVKATQHIVLLIFIGNNNECLPLLTLVTQFRITVMQQLYDVNFIM